MLVRVFLSPVTALIVPFKMSEDSVQGINYLTNLYLRAFYSYHFLSEILQQDEYLQEYSRKFEYSSKVAQSNAQIMTDYLHNSGKRFVLMEPPRMLDFDLKKAAELDRTIRYCVRRLERMAVRDSDEDLLQILKTKIVKKCGSLSQIVKISSEETKIEFHEEQIEIVRKSNDDSSSPDAEGDVKDQESSPKETFSRLVSNLLKNTPFKDVDQEREETASDRPLHEKESPASKSTSGDRPSEVPLPSDDEGRGQEEDCEGESSHDSDESRDESQAEKNVSLEEEEPPQEQDEKVVGQHADSGFLETQDQELEGVATATNDQSLQIEEGEEEKQLVESFQPPTVTGVYTSSMTIDHSLLELAMDLQLQWEHPPKTVLVVKKSNDLGTDKGFVDLLVWLKKEHTDLTIYVESTVLEESSFKEKFLEGKVKETCKILSEPNADGKDIDLAISIGGDGTLLHTASLFPRKMPPIAAFRTGTLNFLVPFKFDKDSVQTVLERILKGCAHVNLRSRIKCEMKGETGEAVGEHTALNEIAVTRGSSPHLCKIDVFMDKKRLARVEGDGMLICTPTGSTAYGLAAGGSVLHPAVSCLQIVPIAPHTICTRSIVVPASSEITFRLDETSRGDATVTSDGAHAFTMTTSDELVMNSSYYPCPILYGVPEDTEGKDSAWLKSFHWCRKLEAPPARDDQVPDCKTCTYIKDPLPK